MEIESLIKRALEIKAKYVKVQEAESGGEWNNERIMEGFVGDVGALMKLIMAKEGARKLPNVDVDKKLAHELCDCLYCVLILANKYKINIGETFMEAMGEIEKKIEIYGN